MKMKKYLCYVLYNLVGKHMPKSNSKLSFASKRIRYILTKGIITSCGKNVNVEKGAEFATDLIIGDNSGIGINSKISSRVTIGKNVMMGPYCLIYTRNHRFSDTNIPIIEQGYEEYRPVIIEDDVWIGGRVIILPGVKIGKGVVIGAGSVVTKDVPSYSIVAGNPAKIIRKRNKNEEK